MTTREENQILTRTGPGTPAGAWMRRYWQPVALSEEVGPGSRPVPVPHPERGSGAVPRRGRPPRPDPAELPAPLQRPQLRPARGRRPTLPSTTAGGLRCAVEHCRAQRAEPPESKFKDEIKAVSYPVCEAAGMVFAYLGAGEPPLLPDYVLARTPGAHAGASRSADQLQLPAGARGRL